jgi:NAD-dependent deacetylase sirtuin 5
MLLCLALCNSLTLTISNRARNAQPNAAHMALAALSQPSVRQLIAPGSTFTLITQNVDGLSQKALEHATSTAGDDVASSQSDQPSILEMHGRLYDVECTSISCGHTEFNLASPICEALAGTDTQVDEGTIDADIPASALPRCSKCNSLARPGVVWFGEMPQHLDTIDDLVDKADLCLVVGTSSTVSLHFGINPTC